MFFYFIFICAIGQSSPCINTIRSIAHGVARDTEGHIVRRVPYSGHGIIVDSNLMIAKGNVITTPSTVPFANQLHKLEKTAQKHGEEFKFWVTDKTVQEVTIQKAEQSAFAFPSGTRRIEVSVSKESDEYKSIVTQLEKANLGGAKGKEDREIIADIFFTVTKENTVPVFATADRGVINPLCRMNPECKKALDRGELSKTYRNGFEVQMKDSTGSDRKIKILPFIM